MVRLRDEEQGATLAIVAISLLCLLGMLVLTFDLGRGVAIKRNMVAAADAGSLAAARECGIGDGYNNAKAAAGQLVNENNKDASVTGFKLDAADCVPAPPAGRNQVTVTASVPWQYFFAQIFGFDKGTVTAQATAQWEAGVVNPVPLKVDQLKVKDCTTDGNGNPRAAGYAGPECAMPYEKLPGDSSNRGILDFPEGWPIQGQDSNPKNCTSNAGGSKDLQNYIDSMGMTGPNAFRAVLWNPPPTYACAEGGVNADAVNAIVDWVNATADKDPPLVVFFPVVACDGPAAPCYPWVNQSGHQAYPVVDFVGLRVIGAWKGRAANAHCEFQRRDSDHFCVQMAVAGKDDASFENGVVVRLIR